MQDGRNQMLGLALPSDFIGRQGRQRLSHDVTAISNVTLCWAVCRSKPAMIPTQHWAADQCAISTGRVESSSISRVAPPKMASRNRE